MQSNQQTLPHSEKDRIVDTSILKDLSRGELESLIVSLLSESKEIIDITTLKRDEKKLQESEEKYRNLFYNHAAVKLIIDAETGAIYDSNSAATEFYGWSNEELKAMNISQINSLSKEEVKNVIESARKGEKKHFEFQHKLADGSIKDVEVYPSAITIGGKPYMHSIVHDISERKKIEKALGKSEKRFKSITRTSGEWIWEVDARGGFGYSNGVIEDIIGYSPEEILQKKFFFDFYSEEDKQTKMPEALKLFQAKKSFSNYEDRIQHKDGRKVDIETKGIPILDDDGELIGYMGSTIDITAQKKAEAELAARTEELENFNRLMVDREMRIIEMKEEVNALCESLKIEKRYSEDWK